MQKKALVIFGTAAAMVFLFQNCAGNSDISPQDTSKKSNLSSNSATNTTTTVVKQSCTSQTLSHCALGAQSDSMLAGTCAAGYTGSCSFSCNDGNWMQLSNTCAVAPGSQSYATPGSYAFTVPAYNTLTVSLVGGGAGGDSWTQITCYPNYGLEYTWPIIGGGTGGASSFNGSVVAYGGTRAGGAGSGAGGNVTVGGGAGGGAGGLALQGIGGCTNARGGGPGGRTTITYTSGQLAVGATIWVVVGAGGAAPDGGYSPSVNGGNGGNGSVSISWQ